MSGCICDRAVLHINAPPASIADVPTSPDATVRLTMSLRAHVTVCVPVVPLVVLVANDVGSGATFSESRVDRRTHDSKEVDAMIMLSMPEGSRNAAATASSTPTLVGCVKVGVDVRVGVDCLKWHLLRCGRILPRPQPVQQRGHDSPTEPVGTDM
jgi:hypothetical protein